MSLKISEIRELSAAGTSGPWGLRYTVINGRTYGYPDVVPEGDDDDGERRLLLVSGSGGARSYTREIVEAQQYDDAEHDAKRIASLPDLEAAVLGGSEPMAEALQLVIGSLDFDREDDVSREVMRRVNAALAAYREHVSDA